VASAAAFMFCGFAPPPYDFQVPGRNCIGPTARSNAVSPSYRPPSESLIRAVPARDPSNRIPRIGGVTNPAAVIDDPP
jgi:hypothetical protein